MPSRFLDLLGVAAAAIAGLLVVLLGVTVPGLRLGLAGLLIFWLPGYAIGAALFPHSSLPRTDRFLYSLGLSIGMAILSGFALHLSPWGLATEAWTILLVGVTLLATALAGVRRRVIPLPETVPTKPLRLSIGQGLWFGLALLITFGAIGFARFEAQRTPPADVLQFWMLAEEASEPLALRLGINSVGEAGGQFRVQIIRGGFIVREWPSINLAPGQDWETRLELTGRQSGSGPFEARLYRVGEPQTVVRQVQLWLEE